MKLFKKLISPLLVALLLAGCSSMSSGVKVGDQEFTSTEIQKTVDEILAARKNVDTTGMDLIVGPELLREQAQFFIVRVLMDKIAKDMFVKVTAADVAARKADVISRLGSESELPAAIVSANLAESNLESYLRVLIISERLHENFVKAGVSESDAPKFVEQLVVETASKLGVKVNSKYGKWNADNASIQASDLTDGAVTEQP
jgi:PBP1b-binding outer membrane lipoprotein LpoB